MAPVTRDYVPQGEELTALEKKRLGRHAAIRTGANHEDFIPDENHVLMKATDAEGKATRALDAAVERAVAAKGNDFARARERLQAWNVAQATDALEKMPLGILRMYLVAEEVGAARVSVLRNFPNPGDDVRLKYASEKYPDLQAAVGEPESPQAEGDQE